jgi:hypothetical protein
MSCPCSLAVYLVVIPSSPLDVTKVIDNPRSFGYNIEVVFEPYVRDGQMIEVRSLRDLSKYGPDDGLKTSR